MDMGVIHYIIYIYIYIYVCVFIIFSSNYSIHEVAWQDCETLTPVPYFVKTQSKKQLYYMTNQLSHNSEANQPVAGYAGQAVAQQPAPEDVLKW